MNVGDKVVVVEGCEDPSLVGKVGIITHAFMEEVWDFPETPEFSVDLGEGENEEGETYKMDNMFFYQHELEVV